MIIKVSKYDLPTEIAHNFLIELRCKVINSLLTELNWITIESLLSKYYSVGLISSNLSSIELKSSINPRSLMIYSFNDYYVLKFSTTYKVNNSNELVDRIIRMIDRGTQVNNPYGVVLKILNEYNSSIIELIQEYEFKLMSEGADED